jgi:hypothetical protein
MRLPDKSSCAREAHIRAQRPLYAEKKEHTAIYLYLARARRFVRENALQSSDMTPARSGSLSTTDSACHFGCCNDQSCHCDKLKDDTFPDVLDTPAVRNVRFEARENGSVGCLSN